MPVEQQRLNFGAEEKSGIIPVRYVVDGVFQTDNQRILVREVPPTAEFSPGTIDLPSFELARVGSERTMRHAVLSIMRAQANVSPEAIDRKPFMADRTIARNNGGYRDTRRIFYKGRIPDDINPLGRFKLVNEEEIAEITEKGLWRRPTILDAIVIARKQLNQDMPVSLIMNSHNEGVIDPQVIALADRSKWNLFDQMQKAEAYESAEAIATGRSR